MTTNRPPYCITLALAASLCALGSASAQDTFEKAQPDSVSALSAFESLAIDPNALSSLNSGSSQDFATMLQRKFTAKELAPAVGLVLFSETDAERQAEIREDLLVMSHLLRKSAMVRLRSESYPRSAMGIQVQPAQSANQRAEAHYIEGTGVVFKVPVFMPLMPIQQATSAAPKEKPKPESEWEKARREALTHSSIETKFDIGGGGSDLMAVVRRRANVQRIFHAPTVTLVKNGVITALAQAKNIRHLKPEEVIIVRLLEAVPATTIASNNDPATALAAINGLASRKPKNADNSRTVMNFRVKVADVLAHKGEGSLGDKIDVHGYVEHY